MCFSESMSLYIGSVGLLASLYFAPINLYASIGIGYFALMEILQYLEILYQDLLFKFQQ
jgi:hypothetical protein